MANESVRPTFVVCVLDAGCDDLSAGMLYRVLPDEKAAGEGYLRVVDDSGEDYEDSRGNCRGTALAVSALTL
jgi:hypothetical protein